MGSPAIFSGRRTRLLTADGIIRPDGTKIDFDGQINYIGNGHAEQGTQGWVRRANTTPSTRPEVSPGGTPSGSVTWTRTTTSPERGQASFLFTKDGSSRQGEMVTADFTIDKADQAKRLTIRAVYSVVSGTYADGDMIAYIVDVTNGQLIEPAGFQIQSVSSVTGTLLCTFQTASNSQAYRLVLFVSSASTAAYTLEFDDIQVGPVNATFSTPVTDMANAYPVTSNITTNATISSRQGRVGDRLLVQGAIVFSGTNTQNAASIILPAGLQIDPNKESSSTARVAIGQWVYRNSGTGVTFSGTITMATGVTGADRVEMQGINPSTNTPATVASGHSIGFEFQVPIVGWSSSAQVVSDSSEGRVVAFRANKSAGSHTANNTWQDVGSWSAAAVDTVGGFNATTGIYTVRVPGVYRVSGVLVFDTSATGTRSVKFLYNGADTGLGTVASGVTGQLTGVSQSVVIRCNAGDTLRMQGFQSSGGSLAYGTTDGGSNFSIDLIQGSQTLLGGETVAARYTLASSQNIVTDTIINYATRDFDTNNSVTTGASWNFAAPISGQYQVSAMFYAPGAAVSVGQEVGLRIRVSGSNRQYLVLYPSPITASTLKTGVGTTTVRLLAGQTLSIVGANFTGNTHALTNEANINWVEVTRVGNY